MDTFHDAREMRVSVGVRVSSVICGDALSSVGCAEAAGGHS